MRGAAGNAAAPTAQRKNVRRGNFMMLPPQSARRRGDAIQPDALQEQITPVMSGGGRGQCPLRALPGLRAISALSPQCKAKRTYTNTRGLRRCDAAVRGRTVQAAS